MQKIKISELKPHPRNCEFFDDMSGAKWNEFIDSIKTSGVIEPIVVTQDKVIVSGHQRVRACKELGIEEILAEVRIYENEDAILKDLIETNIRQRGEIGGSQIMLGNRIKELERIYDVRHGGDRGNQYTGGKTTNGRLDKEVLNQEELAAQMGVTPRTLQRAKALASLPKEIQDAVEAGQISASTASRVIAGLPVDEQVQLISMLPSASKLTQKQVQEYVDKIHMLEQQLNVKGQELANAQDENDELYQKLENQEVRVEVKTVVPDDYESLQDENQQLKQRIEEQTKATHLDKELIGDLSRQNSMYRQQVEFREYKESSTSDAMLFASKCSQFLVSVGGYAYITDTLSELPEPVKADYIKSVKQIASWATGIMNYLTNGGLIE